MELLLLSHFNLEHPLPTIFEVIAQDRLGDSLHGALKFALTSAATAYPRVTAAVHWYEELYLALDAVVQGLFFKYLGASMSEHAFGLRRARVISRGLPGMRQQQQQQQQQQGQIVASAPSVAAMSEAASTATEASTAAAVIPSEAAAAAVSTSAGLGAGVERPVALRGASLAALRPRDVLVAFLLAVIVPYARRRLHAYTTKLNSTRPDDVEDRRREEARRPWLARVNAVIAVVYPVVHLLLELWTMAAMIRYLADLSPHFNWQCAITSTTLRRASRADMQQLQASPAAMRVVRLAQAALMGVAVGFRLLDWWHTADGRDASNAVVRDALPPPEPPRKPPPTAQWRREHGGPSSSAAAADDANDASDAARSSNNHSNNGAPGPADGECGVCGRPYVNPAVNTASGYVFCYPCLHQAVAASRACPVSGMPTTLANIRRLYES